MQELSRKNNLKLYFLECPQLSLAKVVYSDPSLLRPHIALLSENDRPSEAYSKFDTSPAVAACGLLLLRAAKAIITEELNIFPILMGGKYSPAEILYSELNIENNNIFGLLGPIEDKTPTLAKVFRRTKSDDIFAVLLDEYFLRTTEISILFNNQPISSSSEFSELESKMLRNFSFGNLNLKSNIVSLYPSIATEEMKHTISAEVSPKILDLFSKKLEEKLIENGVSAVRSKLDDLTKKELAYHLSQHTELTLVNDSRDWKISFEFEVINAAFVPICQRKHQFWFEQPQDEIQFDVRDDQGRPIQFSILKSSEKYREIVLELPEVLNALDRIKYKISYQIKGTPKQDHLYYLSPRTLTKKLSLTIIGYEGFSFSNPRVAVESEGGFHKDDAPEIKLTSENGIETLHWTQISPKPGELYRTLWSSHDSVSTIPQVGKEKRNNLVSLVERLSNFEQ